MEFLKGCAHNCIVWKLKSLSNRPRVTSRTTELSAAKTMFFSQCLTTHLSFSYNVESRIAQIRRKQRAGFRIQRDYAGRRTPWIGNIYIVVVLSFSFLLKAPVYTAYVRCGTSLNWRNEFAVRAPLPPVK